MNKNLNEKGDLKLLPLILCGGTLFSMHFGASSMVWPMNWGKESGSDFLIAFAGAFITSLLLVVIAYIALAKGTSYLKMTRRIANPKFATFYASVTIAVLGPFYAIPRMSAAAWDSIVQAAAPFGMDLDNKLFLIIFTIIFYVITYFFLVNPGKAMDRISSILLPVLIIVVVAVVGKGILNPIATPVAKTYEGSAFAYGFTNGYATVEILCALVFGVVIFNTMRNKGVPENRMTANMIRIGVVGVALLTCTHFAHMYIGASTGGTIALNYTALYTAVVTILYGNWGGVLFACALFFAALTTSIGLTSGCAEFFVDTVDGKITYKQFALVMVIFSIIFGSLGLTNLLSLLGPILDGIYPTAIVLVIYYSLLPHANTPRMLYACKWAMYVSFVFGMIDMVWKYLVKFNIDVSGVFDLYFRLPFADISMAWIPWTIVAFIVGYVINRNKNDAAEIPTAGTPAN